MRDLAPGLPDWDDRILDLGNPALMDTATLIEWIQQQLETQDETQARHEAMSVEHREWHRTGGGRGQILACCIQVGTIEIDGWWAKYRERG